MKQNLFAILEWTTDGNKKSVTHLSKITEPKKAFNDYKEGDTGTAKWSGSKEHWPIKILAVGDSRKELEEELSEMINILESGIEEVQLNQNKDDKKRKTKEKEETTGTKTKKLKTNKKDDDPLKEKKKEIREENKRKKEAMAAVAFEASKELIGKIAFQQKDDSSSVQDATDLSGPVTHSGNGTSQPTNDISSSLSSLAATYSSLSATYSGISMSQAGKSMSQAGKSMSQPVTNVSNSMSQPVTNVSNSMSQPVTNISNSMSSYSCLPAAQSGNCMSRPATDIIPAATNLGTQSGNGMSQPATDIIPVAINPGTQSGNSMSQPATEITPVKTNPGTQSGNGISQPSTKLNIMSIPAPTNTCTSLPAIRSGNGLSQLSTNSSNSNSISMQTNSSFSGTQSGSGLSQLPINGSNSLSIPVATNLSLSVTESGIVVPQPTDARLENSLSYSYNIPNRLFNAYDLNYRTPLYQPIPYKPFPFSNTSRYQYPSSVIQENSAASQENSADSQEISADNQENSALNYVEEATAANPNTSVSQDTTITEVEDNDASFLSMLQSGMCVDCFQKERQIKILEDQLASAKKEIQKLSMASNLISSPTGSSPQTDKSRRKHDMAEFKILSEKDEMPKGYQLLAERSEVIVQSDWLRELIHKLRKKDPSRAIKSIIDCFLTPEQYGLYGGTSKIRHTEQGKIIKAIENFGLFHFKMTQTEIKRAINEKMYSGRKLMKLKH